MDAEKLIISKQYIELTPSELELVSTYAGSEAEFDDMKAFLLSTQQTFNQQKISSTPELDQKILAHLHSNPSPNKVWYKSLMLFLFPRDTQFYKYPAFQMAIASVLVIGFLNLFNTGSLKEESLAYEDVSVAEEVLYEEELIKETPAELEDSKPKEEITTASNELAEPVQTPTPDDGVSGNGYFYNADDNATKDEVVLNDNSKLQLDVEESKEEKEMIADMESDEDMVVTESIEKANAYAVDIDMMEEVAEIEEVTNSNTTRQDKEFKRKKKDLKLRSESAKSSAPVQNVSTASGTVMESNDMDTSEPIQKISIKNSSELLELFFEVK